LGEQTPAVLAATNARQLVETLAGWLVESGLGGADVRELLAGLCRRLNAGGIAVDRGGCGILRLHPQIVSEEVSWLNARKRGPKWLRRAGRLGLIRLSGRRC
jgi:hypothetical protein